MHRKLDVTAGVTGRALMLAVRIAGFSKRSETINERDSGITRLYRSQALPIPGAAHYLTLLIRWGG